MPKEKRSVLFLDTETTGREKHDRIFQLAFKYDDKSYVGLCKPPVPLSVEAMEATHYTNEHVKDKPEFAELPEVQKLKNILDTNKSVYVVAHNAPFDIAMLAKEGIVIDRYIDTLKVARHLDPQEKLGAYRLQYLRYALSLPVEDARAHDALGDVLVLEALFARLFSKLKEKHTSSRETLKAMQEISMRPVLIRKFNFGKYKGELIADVAKYDPGYLRWLLQEKEKERDEGGDLYNKTATEDWIYTLKSYLNS